MKLKIIIFNLQVLSGQQVLGFKVLPQKQVKQFKKAIKRLEQQQSSFSFGQGQYLWNNEYFTISSISTMESKNLNNIFDMDINGGFSKDIGFIPDPIEQAYDEGLLDDSDTESDYDEYQEDQEF